MKNFIIIIILMLSVSMYSQVYEITDIQMPKDSKVELEAPIKYFVILYNGEATFMYYAHGFSTIPKYRIVPLSSVTLNFNNTMEVTTPSGTTKYWYSEINERQAEYISGTYMNRFRKKS